MKQLKRIVTALSTAAFVAGTLVGLHHCLGQRLAARIIVPVTMLLVAAVHLEFCQMVARKYATLTRTAVVAGVAYLWSRLYGAGACGAFNVPVLLFFVLALRMLCGRCAAPGSGEDRPVEALATTALGLLYVPVTLTPFVALAQRDVLLLLYVIAIVKFSDMGGFALGKLFGRHKLCPSVSPNKTWEGLFGSLLGGALMSAAFVPLTHYAVPKAVSLGLAAAVIGTLGDLVESRMKRDVGVKDSATFMPAGLGGFLDMFDSLIFVPAALGPFL